MVLREVGRKILDLAGDTQESFPQGPQIINIVQPNRLDAHRSPFGQQRATLNDHNSIFDLA